MILESFCISSIGHRNNHEDNFLFNGRYITPAEQKKMTKKWSVCCDQNISANVRFFVVSDGMGGHNADEVASGICVTRLADLESTVQNCANVKDVVGICQRTISEINNEVCTKSRNLSTLKGMGATLVLLIVCGAEYAVLNLGDSREYFFDGIMLKQITKDHTEGQRMFDLNLLTPSEVEKFPTRKNLNRYIGFDDSGIQLTADEYYIEHQNGGVLLCSNGISDSLANAEIERVLKEGSNIKVAAGNIIACAAAKQGSDNATVIIVSSGG